MKTIATYLPVFPGFYNTIFEPNEDSEIKDINNTRKELELKPIDFDDCKFDYDAFRENSAKYCVNFIENELKDVFTTPIKISFDNIYSPREYNFTNDSINVSVELNEALKSEIIEYLKDNLKEFTKHIKDNFTSYDGFMSFYSNDVNEWLTTYVNDIEDKPTILGTFLEFICINEDIKQDEMYEATLGNGSLECTNYTELTTK